MSVAGKRLLLLVVGLMVALFIVLYGVAYFQQSGAKDLHNVERSARAADVVLEADELLTAPTQDGLPAATLARAVQEQANNQYIANRLQRALDLWELALALDGNNRLTRLRLQAAQQQLEQVIRENIGLGNQDYKNLRYARAVYHWRKALHLIRDQDSELYRTTQEKIERTEQRQKS